MTISNFELSQLAKQYNVHLPLANIIMLADLPKMKPSKVFNLIINIAETVETEGHFVALIFRNKDAFYFDSFGREPPEKIVQYCNKYKCKLGYNRTVIQNMESTNCGVYSFALLKYIDGKSLFDGANSYINLFNSKTTSKNDDKLHQILTNLGVKHDYR